jgi:hypothetical protein
LTDSIPHTRSRQLKMRWITCLAAAATVAEASRLTPPVLPLIVRNPYLSTWLGHARDAPWTRWPMFWTGQEVGLSVLAALPQSDTVYPLLGRPQDSLPTSGERCATELMAEGRLQVADEITVSMSRIQLI